MTCVSSAAGTQRPRFGAGGTGGRAAIGAGAGGGGVGGASRTGAAKGADGGGVAR
jgi:hypothetical protein